MAAQGDEVTVVSPVAGVVSLAGKHITDGSSVAKGSVLLNVSAEKMATGDPAKRAYIDYETARKTYERAQELVKDRLFPDRNTNRYIKTMRRRNWLMKPLVEESRAVP